MQNETVNESRTPSYSPRLYVTSSSVTLKPDHSFVGLYIVTVFVAHGTRGGGGGDGGGAAGGADGGHVTTWHAV